MNHVIQLSQRYELHGTIWMTSLVVCILYSISEGLSKWNLAAIRSFVEHGRYDNHVFCDTLNTQIIIIQNIFVRWRVKNFGLPEVEMEMEPNDYGPFIFAGIVLSMERNKCMNKFGFQLKIGKQSTPFLI